MIRILAPLALGAFTGWVAVGVTAERPLFAHSSPVRVGQGSGQVILADLNRDGHLDIVTRRLLHRRLTVLLGNGTTIFPPAGEGPAALEYEPARMAHGDVNHDGVLDLAVASREHGQERVNVLLGNGKGEFRPGIRSPVIVGAAFELYKPEIHLVDVNEDGKLDMLTANGRRNTIEVMRGDGRGGFSRASTLTLEHGQDRYSFVIGDIDGDQHLDVAAAASSDSGRPGTIALFRGDGQGGFNRRIGSTITSASHPYIASVADVNGDKRSDLIVADREDSNLRILLNQGDGQFATLDLPIEAGMSAFHVVVIDVNRDDRPDVIAATVRRRTPPDDSRIVVFLGGARGFSPAPDSPFRAGPGAYDFAVGDINNDRKVDIVASSFGGDALTVLLGQ